MKIYFASDMHLGAAVIKNHRAHEMNFVRWLDSIKEDADEVYLLGDVFDYWFEYKSVVQKGFVRFLGKLCELSDMGIKVHIFTGNHDVWMWDYLPKECGVEVHSEAYTFEADGKRMYVGHGDETGGLDKGYAVLKWMFKCPFVQWCYSLLHPDLSWWIANTWSHTSRKRDNKNIKFHSFRGEKEHQVMFARKQLEKGEKIDYFIFGHRHVVADYPLDGQSKLIVLGEWMKSCTYGVMENGEVSIHNWNEEKDVDSGMWI